MKLQTLSVTTSGTTMGATKSSRYQYWARLLRSESIIAETSRAGSTAVNSDQTITMVMLVIEARTVRSLSNS